MERLTKDALLGASDLVEREVELPSIGGSVKVRSLPAAYSNQAQTEALTLMEGPRGEQQATIDTAKMELIQVLHGLVEPRLSSLKEAEVFATRCGPAFKQVIAVIDEISGVDKASIEQTDATFQVGGAGSNGSHVEVPAAGGDGGSDFHVRTGVGAGDTSR